jgi:hypothetical protein
LINDCPVAGGGSGILFQYAYAKVLGETMAKDEHTDVDEGLSRRVDVALFIIHPTITPAEITAALGIEAHFAHRVGDMRKTPKGTPLVGQHHDTRWRHCIRYELRDQWFADKISALVDSLAPHKAFLRHVRATGGKAEIIVQFLGDGYLGDNVPLQTLTKMTELKLDFGIECFNVPQS